MQIATIHFTGSIGNLLDAVRNVCNASLALLFTIALFLWGFFVNRKQAWRTDGGTAVFGTGALFLAIASCALTFLYIPGARQYDWMPQLAGVVMLWQSFLGWWWWVGAGMGIGEAEEFLKREEKRQKKRAMRHEKRREQREKAREVWAGVTSKLTPMARRRTNATGGSTNASLREGGETTSVETMMMNPMSMPSASSSVTAISDPTFPSSASSAITTSATTSSSSETTHRWLPVRVVAASTTLVRSGLQHLHQSHMLAAQARARERAGRIANAYGPEAMSEPSGVRGWGLGYVGVKAARNERERERVARERRKRGKGKNKGELEKNSDEDEVEEEMEDSDEAVVRDADETLEGEEMSDAEREKRKLERDRAGAGMSMWWWGPLRRWRLQDSTTYG
jgi:hypothetical protein